jgi:hypothetical protein
MLMISSLLSVIAACSATVLRLVSLFPRLSRPTHRPPPMRASWPTPMVVPGARSSSVTYRVSYTDTNGNTWFKLTDSGCGAEELAEALAFCPCDCGQSCTVIHKERLPDNCWEAALKHEPLEISVYKNDPDAFEKHFTLLHWADIRHYTPVNHPDRITFTRTARMLHA